MKHLRLLFLVLLISDWMSAKFLPSKVHPEHLIQKSLACYASHDYCHSDQYLTDALLEYQARYGINSIPYAHALNNLGNVYLSIGNYEEAESCFLKSREIFALKLGKGNSDYALATSNLSAVYSKLAIVERAEKFAKEAADVYMEIGEEYSYNFACTQNILSGIYVIKEDTIKAEHNLLYALQLVDSISKSILDTTEQYDIDHLRLSLLINLGALYCDIAPNRAKEIYQEAIPLLQKLSLEGASEDAIIRQHLGYLFKKEGQYDIAEQLYLSSLQIREQLSGQSYYNDALMYRNLLWLYYESGDLNKIAQYCKKLEFSERNHFLQSLKYMTETQRTEVSYSISYEYEYDFPYFARFYYSYEPFIAQWAYNNELFYKGFLLESSNTIKRSIYSSGDSTIIRKWNDLQTLNQKIISLQTNNSSSEQIIYYKKKAEEIEREITIASSAYRENERKWKITWDSVRNTLCANQVAIECMRTHQNDKSDLYCALLLRDTCSHPILIPLFEEDEVINALKVYSKEAINSSYYYNEEGQELSQLVWSRLLPYINIGDTVFFSPTGIIHKLAIEHLPYDSINVFTDLFNIVRLSSTRELVSRPKSRRNKTAVLYGGIKYDVSIEDLAEQSAQYTPFASRSLGNDTIDRGRAMFLKETKEEITDIQQSLQVKHISVLQYTDLYANEESFKALSGTHTNIIHIATHGFYWEDYKAKKEKFFSQRSSDIGGEIPRNPSIDPLDRCGLLFAGANTALSGHSDRLPEGVQDGILTAKEISTMDLRDADIVVLSACETGLGDISGEGVFGLQRAFKMTGVRSILMALWKVDDKATQILMTSFYRHYTKGKTKREALRLAQQEVRKSGYTDPYYWAGFVLLD